MTRADLAELISSKLGVTAASRARDSVVPPGVLVEPGGREPLTVCWSTQASVRVVAGRADDLDVWEVFDDVVDGLVDLFTKTRSVQIVGSVPGPTSDALGWVDYVTTTIAVRLSEGDA